MAQTLLQPTEYTAIPLAVAHTNIAFAKTVDKSYGEKYFGKPVSLSGKPGQTIQIRLPNKYILRRGAAVNIQAQAEQSVGLTVATEIGIDTQFTDVENTLLVDDFFKRYGEPMGKTIATGEDSDGALQYYNIANSYLLDSTSIATGQGSILKLKQKLLEANIPVDDDINLTIPSMGEAVLAPLYMANFNPQGVISRIVEKGAMSGVAGVNWYMDQVMPVFTTGSATRSYGTVNTTITAEGASTIVLTAVGTGSNGTAAASVIKVGDVFTIGTAASNGVFTVNPETKLTTGALAMFTVIPQGTTSGSAGAGTFVVGATTPDQGYYNTSSGGVVTLTVSPVMYSSASYGLQNLSGLPQSTAAITWLGVASTRYAQCIMNHKTAIALAHVPMEQVGGMEICSNSKIDGMTLRYIRGFDITNGRKISRYDSLYGWLIVRPEWCGRLWIAV